MSGYRSFRPGQEWLDTDGRPIQAHGGSLLAHDGTFYWYGENKEHTRRGNDIWHWGVRCYASTDLYNWRDLGLIISPDEDDPTSPLHPSSHMDRPHLVVDRRSGRFVCWLKVMEADGTQSTTVLTADELTGPYTVVRSGAYDLQMSAGDFDLVVDPDGKAYRYFERVHSELVVADLTDDYTCASGHYSTHLPFGCPPLVREAPAHFLRRGRHHVVTSGTTGYHPNPAMVAAAHSHHGPWQILGDPHPSDASRTSWNSQISSVFRHPAKEGLYIALADRWLPDLPDRYGEQFRDGRLYAAVANTMADLYDSDGSHGVRGSALLPPRPDLTLSFEEFMALTFEADTSVSTYVWLPFRFDGDVPVLDWRDEWSLDEFE
jgi:hypothetical protein